MLQLANVDYLFVPKSFEHHFVRKVVVNYYDCMRLNKDIFLTAETDISSEMLDVLNQYSRIEIFEDQYSHTKGDGDEIFADFMHDIVLTLENQKLSYYSNALDSYKNLCNGTVW